MKLFRKNKIETFFILTLVFISSINIFYSCNLTDCFESSTFNVSCVIYDESAKETSMDSTTIYGLGSDSLLYNNETLESFTLPLRQDSTATSFIIEQKKDNTTYIDTLTFKYIKETKLATIECGTATTATLDTCKISASLTNGGIFDSNIINKRKINSNTTDNVFLYKSTK